MRLLVREAVKAIMMESHYLRQVKLFASVRFVELKFLDVVEF